MTWKIAAVQMDCRFSDKQTNLKTMRARLAEAAQPGVRLVVFPECAVTGYCFQSKDEALPLAETIPGPATGLLAEDCRRLGVWAAVGMLEVVDSRRATAVRVPTLDKARGPASVPVDSWSESTTLFNACALIGPVGQLKVYRKIHPPFLGVDRFTTPGDRPFEVHEVDGVRVGMMICYDGSFPESARCLMLQGADLIILPTNYPTAATSTLKVLVPARALENAIYFAVVNRVGEERGFRFIGQSRVIDVNGEVLASAAERREETVEVEIDPQRARKKRIVHIPG